MARWKLCASKTFEILQLSTCTLCQRKSYIAKGFDRFRNLGLSSWILRVAILVESFSCAGILLLHWQGENFAHVQHLKFCHFQPVHCATKNPISPKVFNRFWKSFPHLDMLWMGTSVQIFRCACILLLQWKVENFAHVKYLKFCHFQPVHCVSKNPISPKVFHRFSKSFPQLVDVEGGHFGGKFQVRRYFTFAIARWKFAHWEHLKFCRYQPVTVSAKSYISKRIQTNFEIFASRRTCWVWAFGWKVSGAQVFYFFNGKVKTLRMDNIWNFATFKLYPVPAKIPYLQRYSTDFRNLWLSSKMLRVAFERKVSGVQVFYFCNGKVKTFRMDNIWNFPLSTCTLCQLKSYIFKGIQQIFENFASARRCWGWAFLGKVSSALVFYFYNGKVKILHIDNLWNFATINLFTVPAKILYLQSVEKRTFSKPHL